MALPVTMQRPGWPGTRTAYEGFSWTTLFWGFLPPLFRGDGIGFLIGLGVWLVSSVLWVVFLGWVPWIVWAALYNRNHLDRLASGGWVPVQWALATPALMPMTTLMAAPQLSAPPGWYPDPIDPRRRRWWDGTAWGEPIS